ncbi:unnamed protein product, partial [Nesidiocoris tenuis]
MSTIIVERADPTVKLIMIVLIRSHVPFLIIMNSIFEERVFKKPMLPFCSPDFIHMISMDRFQLLAHPAPTDLVCGGEPPPKKLFSVHRRCGSSPPLRGRTFCTRSRPAPLENPLSFRMADLQLSYGFNVLFVSATLNLFFNQMDQRFGSRPSPLSGVRQCQTQYPSFVRLERHVLSGSDPSGRQGTPGTTSLVERKANAWNDDELQYQTQATRWTICLHKSKTDPWLMILPPLAFEVVRVRSTTSNHFNSGVHLSSI